MADRLFDIKASAQDAMSAEKKHQFQEIVEADMVAKPMLEATEEMFGMTCLIHLSKIYQSVIKS